MERNALISGYTDVTPFLFYFCNEVYNRLQVDAVPPKTDLDKYLCYYPKQFHFLLKERIETVLLEQQKKLF